MKRWCLRDQQRKRAGVFSYCQQPRYKRERKYHPNTTLLIRIPNAAETHNQTPTLQRKQPPTPSAISLAPIRFTNRKHNLNHTYHEGRQRTNIFIYCKERVSVEYDGQKRQVRKQPVDEKTLIYISPRTSIPKGACLRPHLQGQGDRVIISLSLRGWWKDSAIREPPFQIGKRRHGSAFLSLSQSTTASTREFRRRTIKTARVWRSETVDWDVACLSVVDDSEGEWQWVEMNGRGHGRKEGGREGRADGSGSWNLRSMDCIRSECLGAKWLWLRIWGGKLDENKNCEDGERFGNPSDPLELPDRASRHAQEPASAIVCNCPPPSFAPMGSRIKPLACPSSHTIDVPNW